MAVGSGRGCTAAAAAAAQGSSDASSHSGRPVACSGSTGGGTPLLGNKCSGGKRTGLCTCSYLYQTLSGCTVPCTVLLLIWCTPSQIKLPCVVGGLVVPEQSCSNYCCCSTCSAPSKLLLHTWVCNDESNTCPCLHCSTLVTHG